MPRLPCGIIIINIIIHVNLCNFESCCQQVKKCFTTKENKTSKTESLRPIGFKTCIAVYCQSLFFHIANFASITDLHGRCCLIFMITTCCKINVITVATTICLGNHTKYCNDYNTA